VCGHGNDYLIGGSVISILSIDQVV
jgi:hypothetical protein